MSILFRLYESRFDSELNNVVYLASKSLADRQILDPYYEKQRAANRDDAYRNLIIGKMAEFHVSSIAAWIERETLLPDCAYYPSGKKSWAPDLEYSRFDLHVKSCDRVTIQRTGMRTWVFQLSNTSGKGGRDALFDADNGFVSTVFLDSFKSVSADVYYKARWSDVKNVLVDPMAKRLIGVKKCLNEEFLDVQRFSPLQPRSDWRQAVMYRFA